MRRVALLFPGQGSEAVGMGLALAEASPRAARLLALASGACGLDVRRAIDRGGRALERTEVLQPALVAVSLGAARLAEERGLVPSVVVGHSLGELAAVAFALDLPDEDAIALAALRGRLMGESAAAAPGGLLAVQAADEPALAALLAHGLVLALHNAPDERVVGGPEALLASAGRATGLAMTRLAVAGAWHTPAMEAAVAPFADALRARLGGRALRMPWLTEGGAHPGGHEALADALASALVRPVRFVGTLEALAATGATDVVALAPGRRMRALARRTLGTRAALHVLDAPADLDALVRP